MTPQLPFLAARPLCARQSSRYLVCMTSLFISSVSWCRGCHLSGMEEGVGAQSAELCPGLHRQSWWNQPSVPGLPDSKVYALSTVTLG